MSYTQAELIEKLNQFRKESAETEWLEFKEAKLSIKGKLTKTAILLLGKSESTHYLSPVVGRMTWI